MANTELAFDGAKDFNGHKLCHMCWDQELPKRGKSGPHRCTGGKCECPCRIMKKEVHTKIKRDLSLQAEISTENPLTIS